MLTALGLPGGGVVSVGSTQVRVTPTDMQVPNELAVPAYAVVNGAGTPGSTVDVTRIVVPAATRGSQACCCAGLPPRALRLANHSPTSVEFA